MKRREFFKFTSLAAVGALLPKAANAATPPHVVVIGGGFAGATCAKYLKMWGGHSVQVTVVEEDPNYISPILSNLVLNNVRRINDLTFSYDDLKSRYGISVVHKKAVHIDTDRKIVGMHDGTALSYDKLVLAPGIDFKYTNGYDITKVPHAWVAGEQTLLLKQKIDALRNGETFLMSIPKSPYRCPPGPYERACVVADYLRKKGVRANLIVLDENPDIVVEKETFHQKFSEYGIDYRPNSAVTAVDDVAMSVRVVQNGQTTTIRVQALNVIPNQKGGAAIFLAGVNEGDFAPVDLRSYESLKKRDVYIIGDAHHSTQPKAGHIGNSEAKVCADAILRSLNGLAPMPSPKTNSACYSPVSSTEATWLTAVYKYDSANNKMVLASSTYPAASAPSSQNFYEMFYWAGNLFADTFK